MTNSSRRSFFTSSFGNLRFQQNIWTEASSGDGVMKKPRPVSDETPTGAGCCVAICVRSAPFTMSDDASDITRFSTYL